MRRGEEEACWRSGPVAGGYVRIGSVSVRVRGSNPASTDGRCLTEPSCGSDGRCCLPASGGGCCSPMAKNRAASCFRTSARKSAASYSALDRLPRLPLGGPPAQPPRKRASSSRQEKTAQLKELTEKLKEPVKTAQLKDFQLKEPTHSPPTPPTTDINFDINLDLPKAESRAIVGAYIQRTIPFRSASFSQVDYSSTDGKYNVRPAKTPAKPASLSLPRKKTSEPPISINSPPPPISINPPPPPCSVSVNNESNFTLKASDFSGKSEEVNGLKSVQECDAGAKQTQSCPTSPDQLHPRKPVPPCKSGLVARKQLSDSIEEEVDDKVSENEKNCDKISENEKICVKTEISEKVEPGSPDVKSPTWRPRLIYQSSEEREDEKPRKLLSRANSLSEGESDNGYRETPSRGSPSLFDLSDSESKVYKGHPPRSYSKRPLRGPYGQMLEAEMKKPETRKFAVQQEELKFLSAFGHQSRDRARSADDSQLPAKPNSRGLLSSAKRKVSANLSYSSAGKTDKPEVFHQRTTSSPSQLEGCSSRTNKDNSLLLGNLLKGSSERTLAEANPAHLLINSPTYWKVS